MDKSTISMAIIWYIYHSNIGNLADTDMIIYSNIQYNMLVYQIVNYIKGMKPY